MTDAIDEIKKYTGVIIQPRLCVGCAETDPAVCGPCYNRLYPSVTPSPVGEVRGEGDPSPLTPGQRIISHWSAIFKQHKEYALLIFVREFLSETGCLPSRAEMALAFGFKSGVVDYYLKLLNQGRHATTRSRVMRRVMFLKVNGRPVTAGDIARTLRLTRQVVVYSLSKLQADGLITAQDWQT